MLNSVQKNTIREAINGAKEIFENAGGPLFITDLETGEILECNTESEKLIGHTRDQIIEMNQSQLFPVNKEKKYQEKFSHIKKGTVFDFKAEIQQKNGNNIPVLISAQIFSLHNRDLVMGFYTKIDSLKEQKEKVERFYRNLDQTKTDFISLVSHQMRAPISVISWYSEMLLSGSVGKLNAEQKKYFNIVYENSQKMIKLINGLLNVSRIELGTLAITPVLADITKIADDVLAQLKPQIDKKNVKLLRTYQPNFPQIPVDTKEIEIILKTLLSNAVKYTSVNRVIELAISKNDQHITIEVVDTGCGIPQSQQSKIFTKLFRADNIQNKNAEGIGLNLYIVKSILDQAGGKITFKSIEDKGTSFLVTIPLAGMKKKIGTRNLS